MWSAGEGLLLVRHLHIKGSSFLRELIRGFNQARAHLNFLLETSTLPSSFSVDKILLFFNIVDFLSHNQMISLCQLLSYHKI